MANKRYLRCIKCGLDATPQKVTINGRVENEVGTSTMMRCPDCKVNNDPYATMCRMCCPTSHGTMIYQPDESTNDACERLNK